MYNIIAKPCLDLIPILILVFLITNTGHMNTECLTVLVISHAKALLSLKYFILYTISGPFTIYEQAKQVGFGLFTIFQLLEKVASISNCISTFYKLSSKKPPPPTHTLSHPGMKVDTFPNFLYQISKQ